MAKIKTVVVSFQERVKRGEYIPLERAAELSGYNAAYLRRLCHAKKVAHKLDGRLYYFTPEQVEALMPKDVEVKA